MLGKAIKGMTDAVTGAVNTAKSSMSAPAPTPAPAMPPAQPSPRRGGMFGRFRGMKSGGSVGNASKRADGIAKRGKTKGTFV